MADFLKKPLFSMFSGRVAREHSFSVRKYPIVRDDDGLSARARAFDHFNKGLRPRQLPDLGVTRTTIYRYYESWKRRREDERQRTAACIIRQIPELREMLAEMLRLSVEEVSEAFSHRHAFAALNRCIRAHLVLSLDHLGKADARQIDDLGMLLSAYRGRDRQRYLILFGNWCRQTLRAAEVSNEVRVAVLRALEQNGDGIAELNNLVNDTTELALQPRRKHDVVRDRAEVDGTETRKDRRKLSSEHRAGQSRGSERTAWPLKNGSEILEALHQQEHCARDIRESVRRRDAYARAVREPTEPKSS